MKQDFECVYTINCPISNNIVYIGYTAAANHRFYSHEISYKCKKNNSPLANWIGQLNKIGLKPKFEMVAWHEKEAIQVNIADLY